MNYQRLSQVDKLLVFAIQIRPQDEHLWLYGPGCSQSGGDNRGRNM